MTEETNQTLAEKAGPTDEDTSRLETFADGVMAIAITLLILEVKVPEISADESLGEALLHQWPSYAAYFVSFITIGIIWVNHHDMFKLIRRADHMFLVLNVLFLLTIAFLPWPTALLAEYARDPEGGTSAAIAYGLSMFLIAVMFNVVWRYASGKHRLLFSGVSEKMVRRTNNSYLLGPTIYGAAALIALVNPWISLGIYAGLAIYWLLPGTGPRPEKS
jgi:uncharacterized membrane protein